MQGPMTAHDIVGAMAKLLGSLCLLRSPLAVLQYIKGIYMYILHVHVHVHVHVGIPTAVDPLEYM